MREKKRVSIGVNCKIRRSDKEKVSMIDPETIEMTTSDSAKTYSRKT